MINLGMQGVVMWKQLVPQRKHRHGFYDLPGLNYTGAEDCLETFLKGRVRVWFMPDSLKGKTIFTMPVDNDQFNLSTGAKTKGGLSLCKTEA